MPVIENYHFLSKLHQIFCLQCHLVGAFYFIIIVYFTVIKTILLPMSKDMNLLGFILQKVHDIWSELTVTGVSAKESVEIMHRVLGKI